MAAQYSMPYITAATLAYGPKNYKAFESEYHQGQKIISLIDKTEAHHDPKLDEYLPEHMANRVVVTFGDGSQHAAEVIEALGSPECPLTFDGVFEKAETLINMVDPNIDLPAIADAVRKLPNMADIDNLMQLLIAKNYDSPKTLAVK